ncbi:COG4248: Uncharacterized protein with protein kinase and helix-hairpin-helix DNA-binding domains [Richelia intracellularis HM01]|uniref:DNA-binding protein n=1 Tax=Richelia intracellularis TaxID=1164990 RepID=UPI0002B5030E|nr:DNA-binding protein [Richelia intracellularis]CCH65848.1 COG4248: Uncharacterized protein with protein kinase and helix-hairpin-helix DNA-binding domains [Richelia intracellularis HM01]
MLKLSNHPLVKASNNYTQHNWMIARKKDNLSFADYNRALEINPKEVEAYIPPGMVSVQLAKYYGDYQPDFQKSLQELKHAIDINLSRAEAYFQRGLIRYQIAQYSSKFD